MEDVPRAQYLRATIYIYIVTTYFYLRRSRQVLELWELFLLLWGPLQFVKDNFSFNCVALFPVIILFGVGSIHLFLAKYD